jgi:hypothetical protein
MLNVPITPPRVPLIDERTGLIDRAWYMFFLSLNNAATSTPSVVDDLSPSPESLIASYDAALQALAQDVGTLPPAVQTPVGDDPAIDNGLLSTVAEMQKQIEALASAPSSTQGTITAVTGTAPVVSSGGTTPDISMPAATTSVSGYLTSTDWNTFNGKVTSVSVVSANGLAGTSSGGTTPALTLSTSVTGILKGNGTAISAAVANTDYVPLSTVLTKTADYTITNTDMWIINNKTGSALTLTFPAASSWTGRSITVKNLQAQLVNSASSNIVPIDSASAGTAILLAVVGNWATMVSDGTNWVIMHAAANNCLLLE